MGQWQYTHGANNQGLVNLECTKIVEDASSICRFCSHRTSMTYSEQKGEKKKPFFKIISKENGRKLKQNDTKQLILHCIFTLYRNSFPVLMSSVQI